MIYRMKLATEPFNKIESGAKTIECRLYDEKRRKLKVGDFVEFTDTQDKRRKIISEIMALHISHTFADLFKDFPVVAAGGNTEAEMLRTLRKFYSVEDEEKYGVVGIKIKLIPG